MSIRALTLRLYALYCYAVTAVSLVALALFLDNRWLPITVSCRCEDTLLFPQLLQNLGLLLLFGVQHSVMARPAFKSWLGRHLPTEMERPTYLLLSSLVIAVLVGRWLPFGPVVWDTSGHWMWYVLQVLRGVGVWLILRSVQVMGARDFVGWTQVTGAVSTPQFRTPFPYSVVRHPIYLGTLLVLWGTPLLSVSGLVFNLGMMVYLTIGIVFEERDLHATFGEVYRSYQRRVPALLPWPRRWRVGD